MNQEWAIIGNQDGEILLGLGPFQRSAQCPPERSAFYHNTFSLGVKEPWLIPSSTEVLPAHALAERLSAPSPQQEHKLDWKAPSPTAFREVFDDIAQQISDGHLQKSVPVVSEQATATPAEFFRGLHAVASHHENLMPYGFYYQNTGFLGATPELLFESFEGKLSTMALAGTARPEDYDVFVMDQKEIREHEFVAQTLQNTLSSLGMTRRLDRSVLHLGSLIHFHTALEVELYNSQSLDALVSYLHPTPALGPLPRSPDHLKSLNEYRERLGCPASFGAPFGYYHEGRFRVYVAIRMIHYAEGELKVPAGCGLISASRLTNEWQELALKRQSVKSLFGFA